MNEIDLSASGNINPGRFVMADGVNTGDESTAAGAASVIGISQLQSRREGDTLAAVAGEAIPLQPGKVMHVEAGGTIAPGTENLLTSDATGRAVAASAGGIVVAVALTGGASGDFIRAKLVGPYTYPSA